MAVSPKKIKSKLKRLFSTKGSKKESSSTTLKFVCISDTHTYTHPSKVPDGDVLLHAGDFLLEGTIREIKHFNEFMGKLPHRWKIVIAGNHDKIMQNRDITKPEYMKRLREHLQKEFGVSECRELLTNCTYIEDELIDICGIKIYGSPWTIKYHGFTGFQLPAGQPLKDKWDQIPDDVDILMTHGPPYGICDTTKRGVHAGCKDLLDTVQNRVKPKIHVFGHIHEGYGQHFDGTTTYMNAAICNLKYQTINKPFIFNMTVPVHVSQTGDECMPVSVSTMDISSDDDTVRHKQ